MIGLAGGTNPQRHRLKSGAENPAHRMLESGAMKRTEVSSANAASFSTSSRPINNFPVCGFKTISNPNLVRAAMVSADLSVSQTCISALPSWTNIASSAAAGLPSFNRLINKSME